MTLAGLPGQADMRGGPIQAVACASTGTPPLRWRFNCAAAGIQAIVLLPKGKISVAQLLQPMPRRPVLSLTRISTADGAGPGDHRDETIYLATL